MLDGAIEHTAANTGDRLAGPDDDVLIRNIAAGDREAFELFLGRYLVPIVAFARRYVYSISDAEDIAQETFTRVWIRADRWRDIGGSPRGWVYRIAYNLCIDELRKRRTVVDDFELASEETPETQLGQNIDEQRLRRLIHALPERQRSALWLNAYHGLSNKEAALILGTTVEAMESLLTRARRALRKQLNLSE